MPDDKPSGLVKLTAGIKKFFSREVENISQAPQDSKNLSSINSAWNALKGFFDGEKYPGGLSSASNFTGIDYYILRRLSYIAFTENRYAAGLIKRLLTNEIHKGYTLEATPNADILGLSNDYKNEWTDDVEAKFDIWAENKELVSYNELFTFGQQQLNIRKAALLSGDVLVVLRQHPDLNLPTIQLIDGSHIVSPLKNNTKNRISHGVELDARGKHVAYYIRNRDDITDLNPTRIPAYGAKSGRRIAWLVYGNKIRIDAVRGMPALGILIQALKELDRYADSEQRAALLNSVLAFFIKKGSDKIGTAPITGGAVRRDKVDVDSNISTPRTYNINQYLPGMILEDLQQGEEPVSFSAARPNVNYRAYEEAIMAGFAWAMEIPPNIYRLAFSSNYSASGAEINEFKLYLSRVNSEFSADVTKPFYREWLLSMVLNGLITAPGLLEAWRDPTKFLISGAWFSSEWSGVVKPSLRRSEDIKAYTAAIREGFVTRDIAAKDLFGRKFTTMNKRLFRENNQLVDTLQPLIDAGLIKNENLTSSTTENNE